MIKPVDATTTPAWSALTALHESLDPDLRAWVAAMFFTFGTMLALYGVFFADDEDMAKAAGTNLDLWTGVGMLAFAFSFVVWLLARPPEFEIVSDAERLAGAAEGAANAAEAEDRGEDPSGAAAEASDDAGAVNDVDGLLEEDPAAQGEAQDKGAKD